MAQFVPAVNSAPEIPTADPRPKSAVALPRVRDEYPPGGDGASPRPGVICRCHVCRVELVVDNETQRLKVAPCPMKDPRRAAAVRDRGR